jgi:NADPH:quinone reductase-like Zn-dependent oxidoreductase
MRAVVYTKYGPPDVLSVQEVPTPRPKADEVLVKVHAATMNRTDTGYRSAEYFVSRFFTGLFKPRRQITGSEFAGEVVEVGKKVSEFKIGDRVFGFNDSRFGGHAEYKTEPASGPIATIPEGLSYQQAAAAGEGATYALNDILAVGLRKSQKVLIYGATGAIGTAALQIAKHFGARVTAVCNTKNVGLMKSLGADKILSYEQEDFTKTDEQYDLVFDAVGKITYGSCKHLLKPTGKFASTGGAVILIALWHNITGKKQAIFPIPRINKQNIEFIRRLLQSGEFKPVIDRTYDLDEIVEAAKYAESGQKTGNIIIDVQR